MYVPTNIDIQRGFDANLIMNDVDLNIFFAMKLTAQFSCFSA